MKTEAEQTIQREKQTEKEKRTRKQAENNKELISQHPFHKHIDVSNHANTMKILDINTTNFVFGI